MSHCVEKNTPDDPAPIFYQSILNVKCSKQQRAIFRVSLYIHTQSIEKALHNSAEFESVSLRFALCLQSCNASKYKSW